MNLAIKGHSTRGKEVIEILKMLGGENNEDYWGDNSNLVYYISHTNTIVCNWDYNGCTLEEFLKKYPYKVENKVQHKGATSYGTVYVIEHMNWVNDHIEYEISPLFDYNHTGLVTVLAEDLQPYGEETMEESVRTDSNDTIDIKEFKIKLEIPDGYEFGCVDDNKVVLIPKQSKYPKTYEECCRIVNANPHIRLIYDLSSGQKYAYDVDNLQRYENIRKLIICRDAYWKLAGEEFGLGKPWKPDWYDCGSIKYIIGGYSGEIGYDQNRTTHKILAFPTKEMRDTFYVNFKELIEACKDFL